MLNTILDIFIKPITTIKEKLEEISLKRTFIYAIILSVIFAMCRLKDTLFKQLFVDKFDFDKAKYVMTIDINNVNILELFLSFITAFVILFACIMTITAIMYGISKILKSDNKFNTLLTITVAAIVPFITATILNLLIGWFYEPLGMFIIIGGLAYFIFILLFSFRNTLKIQNENNLVICLVILTTILAIIAYYLLTAVFIGGIFNIGVI